MSGFPFLPVQRKGERVNLFWHKGGTGAKAYVHSLRYACTLFKSLKKSEASVAVRPLCEDCCG